MPRGSKLYHEDDMYDEDEDYWDEDEEWEQEVEQKPPPIKSNLAKGLSEPPKQPPTKNQQVPFIPPVLAAIKASQAAKASSPSAIEANEALPPFTFNTPSPDDLVIEAQTKQGAPSPSGSGAGTSSQSSGPPPPTPKAGQVLHGASFLPQSKFLSQPSSSNHKRGQPTKEVDSNTASLSNLSLSSPSSQPDSHSAGSSHPPHGRPKKDLSDFKMDPDLERECAALEALESSPLPSGGEPTSLLQGLHLVVLGHVDAGKSTLMGRLLHDVGAIGAKEVHRNEREAAQMGKASFSWAWALDERPEERARGVTVDVAMQRFTTDRFKVTLLDAPGHRDFVPNAIAGAAQADAAILLIDGSTGGFEAGFGPLDGQDPPHSFGGGGGSGGGQTREHAQLARSLGIEQLIVVVSKLDTCGFSQERFLSIKEILAPFLIKTCGFKDSSIQWLPAVGPSGQNLISPPTEPMLFKWWNKNNPRGGECPFLTEAIDRFTPRRRETSRPFRMPVSDVSKGKGSGQVTFGGKIESGAIKVGSTLMSLTAPPDHLPCAIKVGSRVVLVPWGTSREAIGVVRAIEVDGEGSLVSGGGVSRVGRGGDSVEVTIHGLDLEHVPRGSVLCHHEYPSPLVMRFEARVLVLEAPIPILKGQQVTLHSHVAREEAFVSNLVATLNPKGPGNEILKAKPRCLIKGQMALIEVTCCRSMVLECFVNFKALGRVALREGGKTIAVGIVTQILESQ